MIWAIKKNERIRASPNNKAYCPLCHEEMISKCGLIKIWHWAHKSNKECDCWWEPESKWHIDWKNKFPKEQQEVTIKNHRADIKTKTGIIIELQSSPISKEEVEERERFYGNKLIWILNLDTIAKNFGIRKSNMFYNLCWKWTPSIVIHAKNPVFVDGELFIWKINFQKKKAIPYDKQKFLEIYGDIYEGVRNEIRRN